MPEIWDKLISEVSIFSFLEIIAVLTAIFYVVLASFGNRWCFLFGLISSLIFVYITFELNFYFDVGINVYYVIMSFYGWFAWSYEKNEQRKPISYVPKRQLKLFILGGITLTLILAYTADRFSSADLAYLDAFTTVFAVIATYMVVQKQIENWLIWIIVDVVAAGMYFYKELYFTTFLFGIYTLIAIFGFFKWKKLLEAK